MRHTKLAAAFYTSLLASSPITFAENNQQPEEIEKLVVVSSRVAMPLREIATSVSLVSQQQIAARGHASLTEVLKTQPAINATSSGGFGSPTALRVRGEEGFRTLVRIDGVDISDPTGPQVSPPLAHVQSANISRVEILRGSQGLVYGADAGGVINIFSAMAKDEFSADLSAQWGRYQSQNVTGNMSATMGDFSYSVAASDYSTQGFNARVSDLSQDQDGYKNTTFHSKLAWQLKDNLALDVVLRNNSGEGEFDNCGFASTASNQCETEFNQANLRTALTYQTTDSEHEFAYSKSIIERENFNQSLSEFLTKGATQRVEYIGQTQFSQRNQLVYGFDWEQEQITTADQSRTGLGYYLEYQAEPIDNLFITAGARHDDNQDFGQHNSVRVSGAYLWMLKDAQLKLRSAFGTGFRAPSLYEIEYNRGPFAFAPATSTYLKEESTQGIEVALGYSTDQDAHIELVYFEQKIQDSIYFDLASYSGYLQDLGQSSSKGIELISRLDLSKALSLHANYTYNRSKDTQGQQRLRRPKHLANIGLDYQAQNLTISANVRFVKDFVDLVLDENTFMSVIKPLDDYQVIDLSAHYKITPKLTVFARIENLFDKSYQDLAAFNTAGETPHVGVRYQF